MDSKSTLEELAAALNGHQVTDDEGNITDEETLAAAESATTEPQTTDETTDEAETAAKPEPPAPQADADGDETDHAVDESGKRYVPEARLKKETAKYRETERRLKALEAELTKGSAPVHEPRNTAAPTKPLDRKEVLEVEMLKSRMPEFDPESETYDPNLDRLGAEILKANPGISRIQAARQARDYAKALASRMTEAKHTARTVKTQQADQGITSRVSRQSTQLDPSKMSLEEMEAHLRESGQW